jgi:thiol-disulfide isomerase/thioredoxin
MNRYAKPVAGNEPPYATQSRRWKRGLGLLLVTAVLPALCGASKDEVVDLSLKDAQGNQVHLHDYRGKTVVLNFWATWCGPCREEMPLLVSAENEYRERGIVFLGASLDAAETQDRIPDFLSKYQVRFPIWLGATGDDMAKLHMGDTVPATAFIDEEGHIVARILGQMRPGEIKERLDWLLGGRTNPAPALLVRHLDEK